VRPELADALHRLRNLASIVDYNAAHLKAHLKLKGDLLASLEDAERAAREIARLVREMDALLG
jgi:hypothetical protein